MPELIPVEHDPFTPMRMTPVDHDPFMPSPAVLDTLRSVPFDYGRQPDNAGPLARVGPLSQAQTDYARALIKTPRIPGQSGGPSLEPVEHTWQEGRTPSFAEALSGGIQTGLRAAGMDTYDARHFGNAATSLGSLFPPVGIPMAADELYSAAQNRDLFGGALAAAGLLPMAKGALTAAKGVASEVAPAVRGIRAFHGSPHDFPAEAEIVNRVTGERSFVPLEQALHPDMVKGIQEGSLQVTEHPLGRFSLDKIGTGEGAQAYGHGLYFAEREGTAKGYRDTLSANQAFEKNGAPTPFGQLSADLRDAAKTGGALHPDQQGLITKQITDLMEQGKSAKWIAKNYGPPAGFEGAWNSALDAAASYKLNKNPGKMYEVNIKADPEHFLDWDKPLSEQSQHVQQVLSDLGIGGQKSMRYGDFRDRFLTPMAALTKDTPLQVLHPEHFFTDGAVRMDAVREYLKNDPQRLKAIEELIGKYKKDTELRGSDIYNALADSGGEGLTSAHGSPDASYKLQEAGIPGLRYLDQGSRNAGGWHITPPDQTVAGKWMVKSSDYNSKGLHFDTEAEAQKALQDKIGGQTRNYVAFDDRMIDIIRKYGIAGLMGGAAAYGALGAGNAKASEPTLIPVDHDPFDYAAGLR